MKKTAFTLAEILISLMILGVIASLTIPSLIQNTQKKEQVVQLKKGLSMINQAITMNYALTGEDFSTSTMDTVAEAVPELKKRLSVVAGGTSSDDWIRTQDGLTYFFKKSSKTKCGYTDEDVVKSDGTEGDGSCYGVIISTKNASQIKQELGADSGLLYDKISQTAKTAAENNGEEQKAGPQTGTKGNLTGYYQFYAGADRVVPSKNTQEILNATDATKSS